MTGEEMSVKDAFFAYAKDKTSLSPRMLAYCLKKAADHCHLKQSLLGMTDVITVEFVLKKIAGDRLLHSWENTQTLRNVTELYYNFIVGYQPCISSSPNETGGDEYPITDNNSEPASQDQNLVEAVENAVLATCLLGISMEELAAKLGVTLLSIKNAAQISSNLVMISGRLIHKDAFVDWEGGANRLEAIIKKLMIKNDGYISYSQLYEYVHTEMQMFLNDNDMDDQRKVFDMAEHLFSKEGYHNKRYTFWMKSHISDARETITSKLDIMRKYARDKGGVFREEELEDHLRSLSINTAGLRPQMRIYDEPIFLFYAPKTFITSESMCINEDWLTKARNAIEKLFDDAGDHVVIRDIQPWWYALLPKLPNGKSWTALLLQSVLFHYSQQVGARTIRALMNQCFDTLNAMIVSIDSEIRTFADAVISVLLDDRIYRREFAAEELRLLLVRRGLIAGNELMRNMPNAIPDDDRFVWSMDGQRVTINL